MMRNFSIPLNTFLKILETLSPFYCHVITGKENLIFSSHISPLVALSAWYLSWFFLASDNPTPFLLASKQSYTMRKESFIIRLGRKEKSDFYSYSILDIMTLLAFTRRLGESWTVSRILSTFINSRGWICATVSKYEGYRHVTLKPVE